MKVHYGESRHFCDDRVCPDPVWKLSRDVWRVTVRSIHELRIRISEGLSEFNVSFRDFNMNYGHADNRMMTWFLETSMQPRLPPCRNLKLEAYRKQTVLVTTPHPGWPRSPPSTTFPTSNLTNTTNNNSNNNKHKTTNCY